MAEHEIEIAIAADGTVKAQVVGAKGEGCLAYAEMLQQIVGRVQSQELTGEYHEPGAQVQLRPLQQKRTR